MNDFLNSHANSNNLTLLNMIKNKTKLYDDTIDVR